MKQIVLLHRLITWHDGVGGKPDSLTWEGDRRHVQILCSQLGVQPTSNGRATPADKGRFTKCHPLAGDELSGNESRLYKSACMRANFIALDRPDAQYVSKELARAMSKPSVFAMEHLKHLARYLLKHPRLVWRFVRQHLPTHVDAFADSNWAGCPVTRKSTTCCVLTLGAHCLSTSSFTQAVISLSSGEAEYYAVVKGACRLIGLVYLLRDLGCVLSPRLWSDSSAGIGIACRRGAAGVRHIETQTLWLQQQVARRKLEIKKKAGKLNDADVGTTVLDENSMTRLCSGMGLVFIDSKAP